jgi:hypothetical protein
MDDSPPGILSSTSTLGAETAPKPIVTFEGNNYDLAAVVGVTIGGIVLLSCATCNLGFYVLPFLPIILGLVGLLTARDSVNPERTKFLSWLSLGSGALILLLILFLVIVYIAIIVIAVASEGESF